LRKILFKKEKEMNIKNKNKKISKECNKNAWDEPIRFKVGSFWA
jgi:hypothetical protein